MMSRQTKAHRFPAIVIFLSLLLGSSLLYADRILVIGDSGAEPSVAPLLSVLQEHGHTDIAVDATPFIGQSWQMRTPERLDDISTWLNERPDVTVVQLSIGGNDWGGSDWTPFWADTAAEKNLIAGIIRNVEVVLDHIHSLRPEIQVLWQDLDFPRPYSQGTPTQINAFLISFAEQKTLFAATRPDLKYVNTLGTLQVAYGFDGIQHTPFDPGFVIPPGDPGLPNPDLPGPFEAFILNEPFHKNAEGHKVVAQALYDSFYGPLLNDQEFPINPGLNDAWYNTTTPGQGILITVFPDIKQMFLAWFTFDTERPPEDVSAILGEPGHRWLTAQGPYDGDTAQLTIYLTEGGVFNAAEPATSTASGGVGTLTIEFADCTEGLAAYEIASLGKSGLIPIERIALDNVPLCEALSGP